MGGHTKHRIASFKLAFVRYCSRSQKREDPAAEGTNMTSSEVLNYSGRSTEWMRSSHFFMLCTLSSR